MHPSEAEVSDDERHVLQVVARIRSTLNGTVDDVEIEGRVRETYASWTDATVRDFIPLLTERRVLESLRT